MKRGRNRAGGRRFAQVAAVGLALAASAPGGEQEPVLFAGDGGWGVVTGLPATATPPSSDWVRDGDLWVGRIPDGSETMDWGGTVLSIAEAQEPPLAPAVLPRQRNAFGPCVVRSLSIRYDSQIRAHRWSLVFAKDGEAPAFHLLELNHGTPVALGLALEDVETGQRWELEPERMGREGGMFERQKGESRLYAGTADGGKLEWHVVVARSPAGRRIVQARIRSFEGPPRLLRLRVKVASEQPGIPILQTELPPAVAAVEGATARAIFVDLAEPRRYRVITDEPGWMGLEFDLAVTRATGNFPRSATASVEVDAWETAGDLENEAVERLSRFGGGEPVPAEVLRDGMGNIPELEPTKTVLVHPGGFAGDEDALHYLMLRMSGLFPDADWAASAFLCAAQAANGGPRITRTGDRAVVAVNPDPDLDTMLEMGQNRGLTLLARVLAGGAPAAWIRTAGADMGIDRHARALHLCDYPAVWDEADPTVDGIGVDLRQAEAELLASLACTLDDRGMELWVEDSGPMAPFTTVYADALVCASADPAEMRRQRALAGPRPVLWIAADAGPEAKALARELGFATPGKMQEDEP